MGSWANSVHVRADDPAAVAEIIRALILAKGYEVDVGQYKPAEAVHGAADDAGSFPDDSGPGTFPEDPKDYDWEQDDADFEDSLADDDEDDGDDFLVAPGAAEPRGPSRRRLVIHKPVQGWVGILDSAGLEEDLAQQLSKKLMTEAMLVYVNDSDSWGFELHSRGVSAGRFDSSGPADDLDDGSIPPEWQKAMEEEDEAELERLLLKNAPQGPIVFHDGRMAPPPEMAMLRAKLAEGRAGLGDRLRYGWLWLKFQCRRLWGWLFPSTLRFGFDVPQSQPLDAASLQSHLDKLNDVFPQADSAALKTLLPQSRFPAEDLLREFLKALGLPEVYAYLNYDYREDFGAEELAEQGVVVTAEMNFVLPPGESK